MIKDNSDITKLTRRIIKKDKLNARLYGILKMIWIVITSLYSFIFIMIVIKNNSQCYYLSREFATSICHLIGFWIYAILLFRRHKKLRRIDYSLPTIGIFKEFKNRYHFFSSEAIWSWVALAFYLIGGMIKDINLVDEFTIIIGIGSVATIIYYYMSSKPLLDATQKLIDDIEGN